MGTAMESQTISRQYAWVLLILTGLFAFRVIAQLIQFVYPIDFLLPYAVWHSGALPYGLLVGIQGVILAACLRIVWGVFKGTLAPSRQKGKILFALGIIYLLGMCIRLIVGLTIVPDHYLVWCHVTNGFSPGVGFIFDTLRPIPLHSFSALVF
jgi:hypothetical protein